MVDSVTITQLSGPAYTWASASFTWGSASAGKPWNAAHPAAYGVAVAVPFGISEVRSGRSSKAVTEQLGLGDAIKRQATLHRTEAIAFAETYADLIAFVLRFVESVAIGDGLTRAARKNLSDALALTDHLTRADTKRLADGVQLGESVSRSMDKRLAESVALADAGRRNTDKRLSESFGMVDDADRAIIKRLSEAIGFAETYSDLIAFVLAISESLGFTEVLGKHTTRPIAESFAMADALKRQAIKKVAEALTVAEAFGRTVAYRRALADGFGIADAIKRAHGLKVNEALELAEQYRRRANGVISDMIVSGTTITEQDFANIVESGHPPGYTDFRDFIQGDHTYRRALFRAILKSQNSDRGFIDGLRVTVDVPDVFDRGSVQITDSANGIAVGFTRAFRIAPEVTITHKGGTVVAVPKLLGAVTTTGFTAVLENSAGTRVTGAFTWIAQGY